MRFRKAVRGEWSANSPSAKERFSLCQTVEAAQTFWQIGGSFHV